MKENDSKMSEEQTLYRAYFEGPSESLTASGFHWLMWWQPSNFKEYPEIQVFFQSLSIRSSFWLASLKSRIPKGLSALISIGMSSSTEAVTEATTAAKKVTIFIIVSVLSICSSYVWKESQRKRRKLAMVPKRNEARVEYIWQQIINQTRFAETDLVQRKRWT